MGPVEVQSEGWAVRGVAQLALQAGVRFHGGVACPELVGKPLEGVRDADTEGAEALAVALEGNFDGWCAADEVVELLIAKGADVNAKVASGPKQGLTPLDIANHPDNPNASVEIADLLRKHCGKTGEELKAAGN